MQRIIRCLGLLLVLSFQHSFSQNITGQVISNEGKPLAFATIKFGNTQNGMVADLDGKFSFRLKKGIAFIEVSYLNYETNRVNVSAADAHLTITLMPAPASFSAVVVSSTTGNKLKRILNSAVANRDKHNPEKYDWYRCNVYYKMTADMLSPDSALKKDTSKDAERLSEFIEAQHLLMTETYSRRTWQSPAQLQEEVIASRMSGFKKALFANLVTDVLPFHSYNSFINLNGRDYYNPISKGLYDRFNFRIADEIMQGSDTLWLISFRPKKDKTELAGTVYITSDGFAITHLIAHAIDTVLNRNIGIEQQYAKHKGRWFPEKLNYTWKMPYFISFKGAKLFLFMKGVSLIDSVSFEKDNSFSFDKAHTTKLLRHADEMRDSGWKSLRPIDLQTKEVKTYRVLDSMGEKHHFDDWLTIGAKLAEGKLPYKMFDINLQRIYSYNDYEKSRFGWGMQTNERVLKKLSIGAWGGYGTGDKQWKYGGFAEVYADKFKEFVFKASYSKDIRDPGRLQINKELDRNYLRAFVIKRADNVEQWYASITKKFGYLTAELAGTREKLEPQYAYAFMSSSKLYNSFRVNELNLNLRYAFGETTAPLFGRYYPTAVRPKYPVVYSRIMNGKMEEPDINYTQVLAAVSWQKNLNRFGFERFLLIGGHTFSNKSLPLSKLFAGNGFVSDNSTLYVFGGMQTMRPYEYYSDRFINFYWMHDLPWRFYYAKVLKRALSSAPKPSIGYNVLWGSMKDKDVHQLVTVNVPYKPYHETGIIVNGLLRLNFLSFGYLTLNAGYFYHWTGRFDASQNGRVVIGMGFEL